jgi:hypothetical protein
MIKEKIADLRRRKVLTSKTDPYYAGVISAGFRYGIYTCSKCATPQMSNRGAEIHCAACGGKLKFVAALTKEEVAKIEKKSEKVCKVCNTPMTLSESAPGKFCVQCGSEIEEKIKEPKKKKEPIESEGEEGAEEESEEDIGLEVASEEGSEEEGGSEEGSEESSEEEEEVAASKEDGKGKGKDKGKAKAKDKKDSDLVIPVLAVTPESTYSKADVKLVLHDQKGDNPFWNVILAGNPVARVSLKDQPHPDEIVEAFVSNTYADNLAEAISKVGAKTVLDQIHARYYINAFKESELAEKLRQELSDELNKGNKKALAKLKDDYSDCIKLVLAGFNKNFFRDLNNPLKANLWSALDKYGVRNPSDIIESCFTDSADEFFNIVLTKAEDFMGKSHEVRDELSKAIKDSGAIVLDNEDEKVEKEEEIETANLAHRLTQANINLDLLGMASGKDSMKAKLRLRNKNI